MSRGGTDDTIGTNDIFCFVADRHMDALCNQLICGNRSVHIGAGNNHAHPLQHKAQRAHGNTANANEVYMLAGHQILFQFFIFITHGFSSQ